MILPTKHLRSESSLIYIGGIIQSALASGSMSVDQLWRSTKTLYYSRTHDNDITYDWFVLALSLLYEIGNITLVDDKIVGGRHDKESIFNASKI